MAFQNSVDANQQGTQYISTLGVWSGIDGGTATHVLTSNGTGVAPSFQAVSASGITTINGDTGSISGATVTIFANNAAQNAGSSVEFVNSGTTSTLNVTDSNLNTIIGNSAGTASVTGTSNTALGRRAAHALTGGVSNTLIGASAGAAMTGTANACALNVCVGQASGGALNSTTNGQANANVLIGYISGTGLTTGSSNSFCGQATATSLTTGNFNAMIGTGSGANYSSSESHNILLNSGGTTAESNTLRIGQATGTGQQQLSTAFISGINGNTVANTKIVTINSSTDQLGTIAPSAAGSMVLLQTLTASTSASLAFTSTVITSTYPAYYVLYNQLKGSASTVHLNLDFSINNGSTYLSSGYASGSQEVAYTSGTFNNSNSGTTCPLNGTSSDFSAWAASGNLYLFGLGVSSNVNGYGDSTGGGTFRIMSSILIGGAAQTINNIRFSFASGTILSGTISLYGIVQ